MRNSKRNHVSEIFDNNPLTAYKMVQWKKYISTLENDDLLFRVQNDNSMWNSQCVRLCYEELKNRNINLDIDIESLISRQKSREVELSENVDTEVQNIKPYMDPKREIENNQEKFPDKPVFDTDCDTVEASPAHYFADENWETVICNLDTDEIIARYSSDDWCDEYRNLCCQELERRNDNSPIVNEDLVVYPESLDSMPNDKVALKKDDLDVLQYVKLPISKEFSGMEKTWANDISELETADIVDRCNSEDWCDEYRNLCYQELEKRNIKSEQCPKELLACQKEVGGSFDRSIKSNENNYIAIRYGKPPVIKKFSGMKQTWMNCIAELKTSEIITRYTSEDWCEEYKYLCYMELQNRDDVL